MTQAPKKAAPMFNLRSLDLNLLTVFEAIYEFGGVSAAATAGSSSGSARTRRPSRFSNNDPMLNGIKPNKSVLATTVGISNRGPRGSQGNRAPYRAVMSAWPHTRARRRAFALFASVVSGRRQRCNEDRVRRGIVACRV